MLNQASKARNWKKWGTWPRLWLCRATCRWCRALCGLWSGKNVQSKTCDIIYDESETIWTFVPPHPKNMIPFNPQLAKAPAATSWDPSAKQLGQTSARWQRSQPNRMHRGMHTGLCVTGGCHGRFLCQSLNMWTATIRNMWSPTSAQSHTWLSW